MKPKKGFILGNYRDPLRGHPRFKTLLEKMEDAGK